MGRDLGPGRGRERAGMRNMSGAGTRGVRAAGPDGADLIGAVRDMWRVRRMRGAGMRARGGGGAGWHRLCNRWGVEVSEVHIRAMVAQVGYGRAVNPPAGNTERDPGLLERGGGTAPVRFDRKLASENEEERRAAELARRLPWWQAVGAGSGEKRVKDATAGAPARSKTFSVAAEVCPSAAGTPIGGASLARPSRLADLPPVEAPRCASAGASWRAAVRAYRGVGATGRVVDVVA